MASMAKYKAALRRMKRRNAVGHEVNFLNITAMMDMMTIILVFLLKSLSASSANLPQTKALPCDDVDADRRGQAGSLFASGFDRAQSSGADAFGNDQHGSFAACHYSVIAPVEDAQPSLSDSGSSPPRLSGLPGCMVDSACL